MKNREFVNQYLLKRLDTKSDLFNEIRYRKNDIEHEEEYDLCDALFDVYDFAEEYANEGVTEAKGVLKDARRVLIDVGFYREVTQAELDNTFTSCGKAQPAFRMDKKMWEADDSIEGWKDDEKA